MQFPRTCSPLGIHFLTNSTCFYGKEAVKSRKMQPIHWNLWIFIDSLFDSALGKLYDCALMSKQMPDFINPIRAAEGKQSIAGQLAFARMTRLAGVVENRGASADVVLAFAVDEQGIPHVRGQVSGEVVLICQCCLESMAVPIHVEMDLGIVGSDEAAKRLPKRYDPLEVRGATLSVAELVEDEILLALPAIPRHEGETCTAVNTAIPQKRHVKAMSDEFAANPFAVLARLKSKQ